VPDGAIEHHVGDGENISDIAARYGVSTASLLAFNGLSWRSVVEAGDVVRVRPNEGAVAVEAVVTELARHSVIEGESVSAIAAAHGVATAAVLLANGLSRGSAIFPGQYLVIPLTGGQRRSPVATGEILGLTSEMRFNAQAIIEAGRAAGVADDGVVIALTAAMQDSALRNLECGEYDAIGLFQQRPSHGWGDPLDLLDPRDAARRFFGGPASPVRAAARGLLDVIGWEFMDIGEAAHAVQRTSSPTAYGKWETSARHWLTELA
jgi:N-acetylmuramoyl-L-alanine amidase